MKMYSSITKVNSRRSSRAKRLRLLTAVVVVLGLVAFLVPVVVRTVVSMALVPVVGVQQWVAASPSTIATYLRDRSALEAENERLRAALEERSTDAGEITRLTEENTKLRELIGNLPEPGIVAAVRAQPPLLPYDSLLIDAGTNDGVVVGAPVYAGANTVIGVIAAVFPRTSVVTLVSTPGVESTVYIYGPNIYTTAIGIGGGMLEIGIPQGIAVGSGDPVIAPALEAGIFGTLTDVISVPTEPEQFAYVSQPLALTELLYVRVGREALPELDFETARQVVEETRITAGLVPVPEGMLIDGPQSTSTATSTANSSVSESGDVPPL